MDSQESLGGTRKVKIYKVKKVFEFQTEIRFESNRKEKQYDIQRLGKADVNNQESPGTKHSKETQKQ